jgi:hypothetical protein
MINIVNHQGFKSETMLVDESHLAPKDDIDEINTLVINTACHMKEKLI